MKFLGLEIGSWAEWAGSLLTAFGIYYAIKENKIKTKVESKYDGLNLEVYLVNKSLSEVKLTVAYAFFYDKRFGGTVLSQHNNPMIPNEGENEVIVRANDSQITTFHPWDEGVEGKDVLFVEYGFIIFGKIKVRNKIRRKLERPE